MIECRIYRQFFRMLIDLRMQIMTPCFRRFIFLYADAMGIRVRIVANPGDLPRDLAMRASTSDLEAILADSLRDIQVRPSRPDCSELVAILLIERFEPLRQLHPGFSGSVEHYIAVVHVHHVWRLDEGVAEVFVFRIQRVVNLVFSILRAERNHEATPTRRDAIVNALRVNVTPELIDTRDFWILITLVPAFYQHPHSSKQPDEWGTRAGRAPACTLGIK